ncbi:uncharacterized protein METZ01_LOCUS99768 [marine metagenome]|uniref:Uncharacterized protein n=1 Tax=marine metagenome TaxID=408172 RepID=A0A381W363_9ZZZZ
MLRKSRENNNKIIHFFSSYPLKITLAITIYIVWKGDNWIKVTGAARLGLRATEYRDSPQRD